MLGNFIDGVADMAGSGHLGNFIDGVVDTVGSAKSFIGDAIGESKAVQRLNAVTALKNNEPAVQSYPPSALSLSPRKVKAIDYYNAELAKRYGMSKSTAYQEALSNTAYQRSVADMKAAGLNPAVLYGAGRGTPASSSVYASSGGSSSGRSYGRSGASSDKMFSSSAYAAIQAIGGLIGIGVSKKPDGFWIGSQTAKGAMGLLDSLWNK